MLYKSIREATRTNGKKYQHTYRKKVSKMKKYDQKITEQNTEVVIGGVILWVALNTHDSKTSYAHTVISKIREQIMDNAEWRLGQINPTLNGQYFVVGRLFIQSAQMEVAYRFSSSGNYLRSPSEKRDFIAVSVVKDDNSIMTLDEIEKASYDLKKLLSN